MTTMATPDGMETQEAQDAPDYDAFFAVPKRQTKEEMTAEILRLKTALWLVYSETILTADGSYAMETADEMHNLSKGTILGLDADDASFFSRHPHWGVERCRRDPVTGERPRHAGRVLSVVRASDLPAGS